MFGRLTALETSISSDMLEMTPTDGRSVSTLQSLLTRCRSAFLVDLGQLCSLLIIAYYQHYIGLLFIGPIHTRRPHFNAMRLLSTVLSQDWRRPELVMFTRKTRNCLNVLNDVQNIWEKFDCHLPIHPRACHLNCVVVARSLL